jgi:hypothetical protein
MPTGVTCGDVIGALYLNECLGGVLCTLWERKLGFFYVKVEWLVAHRFEIESIRCSVATETADACQFM